ncbi:MAG: transcription antitermination protein [Haloplanus sp.]
MTGQELLDAVRAEKETELSRLGSSKALYAVTGGEMETDAVTAAFAGDARRAADVFETWAADADGAAADAFAAAAETAAGHADVDADADPVDTAVYDYLDGLAGDVERAAGLLGRSLVVGKTVEQMVGFFVGDADPRTADTFRGLRGDVETDRDRAVDLLDELCGDDDWDDAEAVVVGVVDAAYDDYVETLESMGVKPKNVC